MQKKILIIEDYLDNYLLLKAQLEELPFSISYAENGIEALKILESESFDLYLVDIQMPELNGYEFLKIIKDRNDSTPAIAQTAHAFEADKEKCLAAGFDNYISKPIDQKLLIEMINNLT